jgi:UDP-N-acetylmuramate--alanine ligase
VSHYHFMGIGGISMSGLAQMLFERGDTVSGCDVALNVLTKQLEARGVRVFEGHAASHITPDVDVLVTSTAISSLDPEVSAARAAGKRVIRRIELLDEMMRGADGIGVTGTHGKTSTTSMIAHVFVKANTDPTVVVGGELETIGGNAKLGRGEHFIAEIDESDAFFQRMRPRTAVITNVEDDHVGLDGDVRNNYHATVAELHTAFRRFAENADVVVYCADWPGLTDMLEGLNTVPYGLLEGATYRATRITLERGTASYDLEVRGETVGRVELIVPGEHSILNSLAAFAVADRAGIGFETITAALKTFTGAGRRWEKLGEVNGALVYDDYAHNPTKVGAALRGAQSTGRRVRVVFQPHRYLRTAREWQKYAEILMPADEVMILDVYSAGETPIAGVHSTLIETRMLERGHRAARYFSSHDDVIAHLLKTADAKDVIVTMGAGDVTKLGRRLVEKHRLEREKEVLG